MFSLKRPPTNSTIPLLESQLYSDSTFYEAFLKDLSNAKLSIIIESPFITQRRLTMLQPALVTAMSRGVRILINTRDPLSHDEVMKQQALDGIHALQKLGVTVLYTGNHHRKLAMIDHKLLWEGSLNILSQADSCEVMRRIESTKLVDQMIKFINLSQWYNQDKL